MRDENCWPYLVEQSCVCIRIDFKINRPDSRCHLPEILIESIFVTTELHPVEKIRPNTETKTVEPDLFIKNGRPSNCLRSPPGIPPTRLIDKIRGESPTQKDILESLAPVRCRLPRFGELSYSVSKNEWIFLCINRLLIKHVCMVAMISTSQ